jgi:hypothetical protein
MTQLDNYLTMAVFELCLSDNSLTLRVSYVSGVPVIINVIMISAAHQRGPALKTL